MPSGTLDVHLVSAKGLEDQNWLTSMNCYVIITCRTQTKKSSVASGAGTKPRWNENFLFIITGDVEEITLRIMDKDTFSSDEFVGEATIPLEEVLRQGEVAERAYNVVREGKFHGEIKVSLTFTSESGSHGRSDEGEYGGRNNYGGSDEDEPRGRRNSHRDSDEVEYGGRRNSHRDSDEVEYGGRRNSHRDSDKEEYGGHRNSRGDSDEEEYGGRRNSRGDSDEEEYGGRGNSRNNSRGDDDDDDYGSRRRSGGGRRGNDEDY